MILFFDVGNDINYEPLYDNKELIKKFNRLSFIIKNKNNLNGCIHIPRPNHYTAFIIKNEYEIKTLKLVSDDSCNPLIHKKISNSLNNKQNIKIYILIYSKE